MSELLDRVARAIGEAYDGYADHVDTPNNWGRAVYAARVAIEAMREPTSAMIEAAHDTRKSEYANSPQAILVCPSWRSMIDAALAEGQ